MHALINKWLKVWAVRMSSYQFMHIMITVGENDNGYLTLRPGSESVITIILLNVGGDDTFRISVDTDVTSNEVGYFWYTLTPESVIATQNVPTPISVQIFLNSSIPNGFSVTFTLVVQSTSNFDINDFISFDVVIVQEVSKIQLCL